MTDPTGSPPPGTMPALSPHIDEPLSRKDAYFLFSKLKRMMAAQQLALMEVMAGNNEKAWAHHLEALTASQEVEPLINELAFGGVPNDRS